MSGKLMAQCSLRFQLNFLLGILALLKKKNILAPVSLSDQEWVF